MIGKNSSYHVVAVLSLVVCLQAPYRSTLAGVPDHTGASLLVMSSFYLFNSNYNYDVADYSVTVPNYLPESRMPGCLVHREKVTGHLTDSPSFIKNTTPPSFQSVPVSLLDAVAQSTKHLRKQQENYQTTSTAHEARPDRSRQKDHDLELLMGIDEDGYLFFLIFEADGSGKPAKVKKIRTEQFYLTLNVRNLWPWLDTFNSIKLSSTCNAWQKLLNELWHMSYSSESGQLHPEALESQLISLVRIMETIPENKNTTYKKPELYSLPNSPHRLTFSQPEPATSSEEDLPHSQEDAESETSSQDSGSDEQQGASGHREEQASAEDMTLERALRIIELDITVLDQTDASKVINTRFHTLALKHHPDKKGGSHEKFLELKSAAQFLKKKLNSEGVAETLEQILTNLEDMFEQYQKSMSREMAELRRGVDEVEKSMQELKRFYKRYRSDSSSDDEQPNFYKRYHSDSSRGDEPVRPKK